jgi:heme-degrading monooxygenase HmoA
MTAITTMVIFDVPPQNVEEFIKIWRVSEEFLNQQPGILGGVLYRSSHDDGQVQFVNAARWESEEALASALKSLGKDRPDLGDVFKRLDVHFKQSNYTEYLRY